jgi:peptidyl-tRNA hydrolase, PTH1 family
MIFMKLIVGLGNPGKKYETTRHNTGFMAVDAIASKLQITNYKLQINFNSEISEGTIGDEKIILAKPQTFMNESGKAVKAVASYYKIPAENIIVIHDDLDIPIGEYKIVQDRGSAGHKGVQSIIDALETKDFIRIRIGIGIENKPLDSSTAGESLGASKIPTEAFVLKNFTKEKKEIIDEVIEKIAKEIEILIKK